MSQEKAKVKIETDYTYTDKFSKKKLNFTPKKDEVLATFQPPITEDTLNEVMSNASMSISQGFNLKRKFAVFNVPQEKNIETATKMLESQPKIANTIPVMVDQEGATRYFMPDEFTVQFKQEVGKDQAERIIEENKSWIIVKQRTPGYYTLAVPKGKGLFETIREFADLPEVAFVEPSEAGFNDALSYTPADPEFSKLWGLNNTGRP